VYKKFAYNFGYNWKGDSEAGAAMAFGISSPGNYSQSFIEGSQNRAGIFGILNYPSGYFFTRLTGTFILSIGAQTTNNPCNQSTNHP
jgi:hypothetical protein